MKPKKARPTGEDAQPDDVYEAEAPLPVEEQAKNVNKRYDVSLRAWMPRERATVSRHACAAF